MIIWLTGNTGAGKTTLAYAVKEKENVVILDGDEMRSSISLGAGFSKEDREEHNLRVARLAKVLEKQGHKVLVSVIAPFSSTREKINDICHPYWVYLKSPELTPDKPYEVPEDPHMTLDRVAVEDNVEKIMELLK